jgi:hypothetical protein
MRRVRNYASRPGEVEIDLIVTLFTSRTDQQVGQSKAKWNFKIVMDPQRRCD